VKVLCHQLGEILWTCPHGSEIAYLALPLCVLSWNLVLQLGSSGLWLERRTCVTDIIQLGRISLGFDQLFLGPKILCDDGQLSRGEFASGSFLGEIICFGVAASRDLPEADANSLFGFLSDNSSMESL